MRMPSAMFAAVLLAGPAAYASDHDVDQQVAADPRGIVEISNFAGRVEVSGWDQLQVSVHSSNSSDNVSVDLNGGHSHTSITVRPHGVWGGGGEADLRIKIPRGSELDVTSVSADITANGIVGMQRLKTVSGTIKADFAADVEAKTVSGDVRLVGAGKPVEMHLSSISGTIRLEHGAGEADATTVSGDLNLQLDPARSVRARNTSGRTVVEGSLTKDADVDAQSVSGDIRLHANAQSGYEYEVSTFSGSIRNCFNQQAERVSQYGPGERLNGTRDKGSGHVRLKTMSGQIEICDKS
jgi:DUF4097 and DUF4098 domain-containing protein YvlB